MLPVKTERKGLEHKAHTLTIWLTEKFHTLPYYWWNHFPIIVIFDKLE
jgi:hypothetical protein